MSNQKPRTINEQIRLLRSRGMAFGNEEKAKLCLAHISYFRLKYYWTDIRDGDTEHDFKEGASFDEVIARYNFDRNLRLILFDAIEIIEVALRAKIINHLSQAKGDIEGNLHPCVQYFFSTLNSIIPIFMIVSLTYTCHQPMPTSLHLC